ncbi:HET-C-related protein [Pseudomonas urmiensis]|uniref:HET-C-related protein n=1 Tax=Pseudomonas urmiensis TaxID=2745493 RepID=UPI003C808944
MKKLTDHAPQQLSPTPRFGAGLGDSAESHGHESIAQVLNLSGFNAVEVKQIYFGNWLRDHSQLIDPKIVRPQDARRNFPTKISREVLTEFVDLLALIEFNRLQMSDEERVAYTVTPEILGVYRPSEHIDNPTNLDECAIDPQTIDEDFEPLVRPGDRLTTVHYARSMTMHIEEAERYMRRKLRAAMRAGKTPTGMRYFGEALHVLEDFFAHSNFVELSLRKVGYTDVLAWTTEKPCKHRWPVVTGLFSGSDILASVAEPLAKILFPAPGHVFKPTVPGERSDGEQALLILLKEDPEWRAILVKALEVRDELANSSTFQTLEYLDWLVSTPFRTLRNLTNSLMQTVVEWAGDQIDELQTYLGDDPNTHAHVSATHSQLAKDHDTHPFHLIAQLLARYAVDKVGQSIYKYWQGDQEQDPVEIASSFFWHPNDLDWQDEIVNLWASRNPEKIAEGTELSLYIKRYEQYRAAARKRLEELETREPLDLIGAGENLSGSGFQ